MGRLQYDLRRGVAVECFLPAGGAQAPTVAGLEAGKAILRQGGAEVVAVGLGKARNAEVVTTQTVCRPTSSAPVLQQPSR
jgi:hypothetical protein